MRWQPAVIFALFSILTFAGEDQLLFWKIGSPYLGNKPDEYVADPFSRRAGEMGLCVRVVTMHAADFFDRFLWATREGRQPDILFVENYGSIRGAETPLGHFEGIAQWAHVSATMIRVDGSFSRVVSQPGWFFLFTTSANHDAAYDLALEPLFDRPVPEPEGDPEAYEVAELAIRSFFRGDGHMLGLLSAGRVSAPDEEGLEVDEIQFLEYCPTGEQVSIRARVVFRGNDRLGRVQLVATLTGKNDAWRLVHLGPEQQSPNR